MALRRSTAKSRRRLYTLAASDTNSCGPFNAATEANWLIVEGHEELCDCSTLMAAMIDGASCVADAPAGHRVGLRNNIDDQNADGEFGSDLQQVRRFRRLEPDLVINFVGQHADVSMA